MRNIRQNLFLAFIYNILGVEVRIGEVIKRGEESHNGKPAVILRIQKQPGANTLGLTHAPDNVLDEIQASLPAGVRIVQT